MSRRFELLRGKTVLGVVTLDQAESNFPWFVGWLKPSPAYDAVRPLFDELDRLLDDEPDAPHEQMVRDLRLRADALHEHILAPGVHMRAVDGGGVTVVTGIIISGILVCWR